MNCIHLSFFLKKTSFELKYLSYNIFCFVMLQVQLLTSMSKFSCCWFPNRIIMKIDRSRLKKSTSEVVSVTAISPLWLVSHSPLLFCCLLQPIECQALIEKLRSCSPAELLEELKRIDSWTFGKCELYHWIDILDICDAILEEAAMRAGENTWTLACDLPHKSEVWWMVSFFLVSECVKDRLGFHLFIHGVYFFCSWKICSYGSCILLPCSLSIPFQDIFTIQWRD